MPHRVWNFCACFSFLILQGNQCFWLAENLLQPIRGTTQIWLVTRHQYGFSALLSQTSLHGETSGGVTKCHLFSKATDLYEMSSFWSTNKISFSILVLGIIIREWIKYFTVVLFWKESYYRGIRIIAKFVVSRCTFANFEFLFRQSFEWGRVNANHNLQHTRSAWPAKTKLRMTLDCSRIAKEITMMNGIFVEGRRQTLLYFSNARVKNKKVQKIFEEN